MEEFDDVKLESRRFSTEDLHLETKMHAASLNLSTIIRYIESPLDLQLKFLCASIERYSKQNGNDVDKMKVVDSYFVSELSRIILAAKEKIVTEKKTLNATLRLSRYGNEVVRVGNLLNLQFKKAEKYQKKSGYIPKQVQMEINQLFTEFVKIFKSEYLGDREIDNPAVVTQSNTNKKNVIKIMLDVTKVDPKVHFEQVDKILDKNQVGIYQIHDKLTNLGYYEIEFLDDVDQKVVNGIKSDIGKLN